jgi:hypothetical protein
VSDVNPDPDDASGNIKLLRERAKAADEAEARAAAAERRLAFAEAGIALDAKTQYFVKGYDGELSAEAIRAAATEAGLIGETTTEDPIPQAERDANRRMNEARGGGNEGGIDGPSIDAQIAATTTREELDALISAHPENFPGFMQFKG